MLTRYERDLIREAVKYFIYREQEEEFGLDPEDVDAAQDNIKHKFDALDHYEDDLEEIVLVKVEALIASERDSLLGADQDI